MAGKCFERCLPASPSLWLPQTKGPALSAATQQATKGSLSERHKERKEGHVCQALALRGFSLLMPVTVKMHPEVWVDSPTERSSHCLGDVFQSKVKNLWLKLNGWARKKPARCHVAGTCWRAMDKIQMRQFVLRGGWVRNVFKKDSRVLDERSFSSS